MASDSNRIRVATGRVGVIDAALIRWLGRQRELSDQLWACVTGSALDPLIRSEAIERFLAALEVVGAVVRLDASGHVTAPLATLPRELCGRWTVALPERELLHYTLARIWKRADVGGCASSSEKVTSVTHLAERYGACPEHRAKVVGIVSGAFDLLHHGHVRLIENAKERVDVLVVLAMSSVSIEGQPKNVLGDRPIYSEGDRAEVLSALRSVDHIVFFDEPDCRAALSGFCPNYYVKTAHDAARSVVRAEADVVTRLGGKITILERPPSACSSTAIIARLRGAGLPG